VDLVLGHEVARRVHEELVTHPQAHMAGQIGAQHDLALIEPK
jgi:hypothetical protein